ncbi:U6 snRNA-associated Sm-like protein LSm7 [Mycena olivaceomarginata]|nr:U6 snRNA-associated Sm-like protein LSm7 [Mycena olivaceomarginata]
MADRGRGAARGNRGAGGGGNFRGGRHGGPQGSLPTMDKPKREAILDLSKYVNERIRVKFTGGREDRDTDQLLNLVLDEVEEQLLEPEPHTRSLGLTVLHGSEEIANPFLGQE